MTEETPYALDQVPKPLRFTRWGLSMGIAAAAATFFITVMLYLPGTQTQEGAASARETATLLATIVGLPTSLVTAPVAGGVAGFAGWAAIGVVPVVNGLALGVLADVVRGLVRPTSR